MKICLPVFLIAILSAVQGYGQHNASPNIILILADDLGWSNLASSMTKTHPEAASDYHETPNLDKLMQQGMRFSRGYSSAAICSPSRRSILFGQTPIRQGDETFPEVYNPRHADLLSIPQALKRINATYKAAHYGKWDLRAGIFPEDVGYDESDGNTGNRHGDVMMDKEVKWTEHFINDDPKRMSSLTERSMNFMERQVNSQHPFYLQISHYATHVDIQARPDTYNKYLKKERGKKDAEPGWAAMLEDLDHCVGQILKKVEALGIGDNTYVVFMSDNGSPEFIPPVSNRLDHPSGFDRPMRNFPLRGGKWALYEGGIRVPFIVKGPDVKPNSQCDVPVTGWDILPTLCEWAGKKLAANEKLDGGSFASLVRNEGRGFVERPTDKLIFHRYNDRYPHSAVIDGNFKVIKFWKSGKVELYDLGKDPGELNDIAAEYPKRARDLERSLSLYIKKVNPDILSRYK